MKHILMEAEDRGWWSIEGNVCADCVGEEFLGEFISRTVGACSCDFCGRSSENPFAADADMVMDLIGRGIYREWTHPAQVMGWVDGEWVGDTYEIEDVLRESGLDAKDEFRERVTGAFIDEAWCRSDPYGLERHEVLSYGWKRFADHVKRHTRYVFLLERDESPYPDRDEIHPGLMLQRLDEVVRATGIVRPLPKGTRYVRARDHGSHEAPRAAAELGTPPSDNATKPNRMSPTGIPMFYGASDIDTALAELAHSSRPVVTLAEFQTLRDFSVVDLSRIPSVPSLFDDARARDRDDFRFLDDFAGAISAPIEADSSDHIEYVPTQIVTEYFRHIFRNDNGSVLDGLLYRSSQRSGGECCVLFVENDQCVDDAAEDAEALLLIDASSVVTRRLRGRTHQVRRWLMTRGPERFGKWS
jgi:hypothetical protein